jgi:AbiV family abortive infection protein
MAGKKLDAYKGRLTPAQIAQGINAATCNAKRLADDAVLLLEAKRVPSAASIAILAIEEAGKVSILRVLALAKDDKSADDCWRDYRSHTKKNVTWLLPQLVSKGARRLDDFKSLFDGTSNYPFILDQIKQIGFYTDCLGKAHWSVPHEVIDERVARTLVHTAQIIATKRTTSSKEIELWIKNIGPIWKGNPAWMKKALANWYAEMQEASLAPEGDNEMEMFIGPGLSRE